jgi:hypothetical protein
MDKHEKHRFTIHFEVTYKVFQLLSRLGKLHGRSPNDAARDIIMAWMLQVQNEVRGSEESSGESNDSSQAKRVISD